MFSVGIDTPGPGNRKAWMISFPVMGARFLCGFPVINYTTKHHFDLLSKYWLRKDEGIGAKEPYESGATQCSRAVGPQLFHFYASAREDHCVGTTFFYVAGVICCKININRSDSA